MNILCNYFQKKETTTVESFENIYGPWKYAVFSNVVHNISHRFENNSALWIRNKKLLWVILLPVTNEYNTTNSLAICIFGNFFLLLVDAFAFPKYASCIHGNKQHYKCSIVVVISETNSKRITYWQKLSNVPLVRNVCISRMRAQRWQKSYQQQQVATTAMTRVHAHKLRGTRINTRKCVLQQLHIRPLSSLRFDGTQKPKRLW